MSDLPVVERWARDTSDLMWNPVVRFFVGGPLDGRAIEGADSREWEAGPMAATSDYWEDWFLYRPAGGRSPHSCLRESLQLAVDGSWIIYLLDTAEVMRRAKARYVAGKIDFAGFEQATGWALAAERDIAMFRNVQART